MSRARKPVRSPPAAGRLRGGADLAALPGTLTIRARLAGLQKAFDAAPFGVWVRDRDGRMVMQNAVIRRQWGNQLGKLASESGFPAEVVAQWQRNNRRVLAGHVVREEAAYRVGGKDRLYYTVAAPFRVGRRIAGLLGYVIDITDRRRAEAALREAEERYRMASDAAGVATWRADMVRGHTTSSGHLDRLLGYRPGSVHDWFALVPPDERTALRRAWAEGLASRRQRLDVEHRARHRDGSLRWLEVHARVLRRADGTPVQVVGASRDITRRKQAEEALRQSETRYRTWMEAIPTLAWRCDPAGGVMACNRRWYEYTGQTPRRALGNGWMRAVHPDDRGRTARRVRSDVDGGVSYENEYRLRRARDGAYRWHVARALPVRDGNGRILGWFGAAADIDDQKRAEEAVRTFAAELDRRVQARTAALRQLNLELEDEIGERKRLAQQILDVSEREQRRIGQDLHDSLGQQLAGIAFLVGSLQRALKDSAPDAAKAARDIGRLLQEAMRQMRTLARGLHPVATDGPDLAAALEELAAGVRRLYRIPCRVEVERPELCGSEAVTANLYRIAQEAVSNAVRHGRPGRIAIRLGPARGGLRLSIVDDGRGLPPRARRSKGMGLAMMNHRAASIGATLIIHSGPRVGTTVRCDVPAALCRR